MTQKLIHSNQINKALGLTPPSQFQSREMFDAWNVFTRQMREGYTYSIFDRDTIHELHQRMLAQTPESVQEFILTIQSVLNEGHRFLSVVTYTISQENIEEKIQFYAQFIPPQFRDTFIEYVIKGELPPQEYIQSVQAYIDEVYNKHYSDALENIELESEYRDPVDLFYQLQTNTLRLDDATRKAAARNNQPVTKEELEQLLNSTQNIGNTLSTTTQTLSIPQSDSTRAPNQKNTIPVIPKTSTTSLTDSFLTPRQNK